MAIEHGKIPPRDGWVYVGSDDLGSLSGTCEYCDTQMRYSHLICHKDWAPLEVGQDCCDRLTASDEATEAQKTILAIHEKRKRFVSSPRWEFFYDEYNYKIHKIKLDYYLILITEEASEYTIKINNIKSKKRHTSLNEAKIKAFDVITSGEFTKYVRNKNQANSKKES